MMTEFGLIEAIRRGCEMLPKHDFEGIGDDCAVLPIGGDEVLVFTADLLVEQIHFLREAATPEEVAHKALHVNLSDVASMGVRPVATLLSVALPREMMQGDWAERFTQGYIRASKACDVALIGGDTTASERDIVINVPAIGRGSRSCLKRRSAARVGDLVCVCGELGASGAGLRELLSGNPESPLARLHKLPTAQIREGILLGEWPEVHAMMDLSDGLAGDLRHILKASQTGAEVALEQIPVAEGADLDTALSGGEDYKLLLTLAPEAFEELKHTLHERLGCPLYPIGRIVESAMPEIRWLRHGEEVEGRRGGFCHY